MYEIIDGYIFKTKKIEQSEITENIGAAVKTEEGARLEFNVNTGEWEYADGLQAAGD